MVGSTLGQHNFLNKNYIGPTLAPMEQFSALVDQHTWASINPINKMTLNQHWHPPLAVCYLGYCSRGGIQDTEHSINCIHVYVISLSSILLRSKANAKILPIVLLLCSQTKVTFICNQDYMTLYNLWYGYHRKETTI